MEQQASININRVHSHKLPTIRGFVDQKLVIEVIKNYYGWFISYSRFINDYPNETINLLDAINETVELAEITDMIDFLNKKIAKDK